MQKCIGIAIGHDHRSLRVSTPATDGPSVSSDWSPATRVLLDALSPLQRQWIEWRACGLSGAEAYRRAAGRDPGAGARNNARQLAARPAVRAALAAALGERGAEARTEWGRLLAVVRAELDAAEQTPAGDRQKCISRLGRMASRLERVLRATAGAVPVASAERLPVATAGRVTPAIPPGSGGSAAPTAVPCSPPPTGGSAPPAPPRLYFGLYGEVSTRR
jgi:hypothetical protein